MGLLDEHVTKQSLPMMKMAGYHHVSNQCGLGTEPGQILQTESCLRYLLFKQVVSLVPRWLNYWLGQRLSVLIHDQCLDAWPEDLLSVRVILFVLMQNHLVAASVIVIIFLHGLVLICVVVGGLTQAVPALQRDP
jgi:hypothetical protein